MPAAPAEPRLCPIADALAVVGERWSLLVVRELFRGAHRFSDIQRNTGAPRDVLTARLRSLVEAGVIETRRYSEHPPRSSYHLTAAGRDLSPVLLALTQWGVKHLDDEPWDLPTHGDDAHPIAPRVRAECATCRAPI